MAVRRRADHRLTSCSPGRGTPLGGPGLDVFGGTRHLRQLEISAQRGRQHLDFELQLPRRRSGPLQLDIDQGGHPLPGLDVSGVAHLLDVDLGVLVPQLGPQRVGIGQPAAGRPAPGTAPRRGLMTTAARGWPRQGSALVVAQRTSIVPVHPARPVRPASARPWGRYDPWANPAPGNGFADTEPPF